MPTNKMVKVHHNLVEPQKESPAPGKTAVTQGSPAPVKMPAVPQESPAPVETTKTKQKTPGDSLNDGLSMLYTPASTTRRKY